MTSTRSTRPYDIALLAIVAGMVLVALFWPAAELRWGLAATWVVNLVLMFVFTAVAARRVTGFWRGALIDERRRVSLSRLQMLVWTVLVLSALFTAALWNLRMSDQPLDIALPEQLWLLLGISTASLIGSPLIKGQKKLKEPEHPVSDDDKRSEGLIVVNRTAKDAGWGDLFAGEETDNYTALDLGKIQMFLFTLVLVLAYGFAIATLFATTREAVTAFPDLNGGITVLLGISHTGYLTNKALPLSKEAP